MVEHVFCRAALYPKWDALCLATCDREIFDLGKAKGWPSIMTSDKHTRALDRVAEAAGKCGQPLEGGDIVVCVQGDEPMLHPDMIAASILPLEEGPDVPCAVLAMEITAEEQFHDANTLKIIYDKKGDVLYTSRVGIPYCKKFPPRELLPRRIYGIFAFRWHFLQTFTGMPQSPLELVESCDSNRIMDNGYRQRIGVILSPVVLGGYPADIAAVEKNMVADPLGEVLILTKLLTGRSALVTGGTRGKAPP